MDIIQKAPNNTKKIVEILNYAPKNNIIENRKPKVSKKKAGFLYKDTSAHDTFLYFSQRILILQG